MHPRQTDTDRQTDTQTANFIYPTITMGETTSNRFHIPVTRYDSVYLMCSKKLTGSQLSLPHGINKKIKLWN